VMAFFRSVPVPLYADVDKRASEVLTKEFPSEKEEKKLSFRGETFDGVVRFSPSFWHCSFLNSFSDWRRSWKPFYTKRKKAK
jgi:hypothetical protein